MKMKSLLTGLIIGILIGFAATKIFTGHKNQPDNIVAANKNKPVSNTWQWADSLDAVTAAAQNHRVIFENDKIRILDVILKPYEYEQMHTHQLPGVMFGNNNKDTSQFDIVYYRYQYDSVKHLYYAKDSIKQHGGGADSSSTDDAHFMKPEGPHRIKNLSNTTIDVYRVEFKPIVKNDQSD